MDIKIKDTLAGRMLLVNADESLSFREYPVFHQVTGLAADPRTSVIALDLRRTRKIFDSGKAMLVTLSEHAAHLKDRIRLLNARPEIKRQLSQGSLRDLFQFESNSGMGYPRPADTQSRIDRYHERTRVQHQATGAAS